MGRRAPHRRLTRLAVVLATLLLLVGGCARVPPTTTEDPHAGQLLAERLNNAVRDQKLASFLANFADEPVIAGLAQRWYRYLAAVASTVTSDAGSSLQITSQLPGDRRPATVTLAMSLGQRDGQPVISAVRRVTGRLPLWLLEPVDLTPAKHGTVLSSGLSPGARNTIASRLDVAAIAVAKSGAVSAKEGWSGQIVVEVPATAADFTAVSGFDATDTAAATQCGEGTPRIVLSPTLDRHWDDITLLHEAVHAATDSACGVGTEWAVEGLAEWVTGRVHPPVAADNRALVQAYLQANGIPTALPHGLKTQTDYALAVVAVDQVFTHLPRGAAVEYLDRVIHDPAVEPSPSTPVTDWYLAELRRLARSG